MASFSLTWTTLVCVLAIAVASASAEGAKGPLCYVWYRGRTDLDPDCPGTEPGGSVRMLLGLDQVGEKLALRQVVDTKCVRDLKRCSSIKADITMTRDQGKGSHVVVKWTATWDSGSENQLSEHGVSVTPAASQGGLTKGEITDFNLIAHQIIFTREVKPTVGAAGQQFDLGDGKWDVSFAVSEYDETGTQIGDTVTASGLRRAPPAAPPADAPAEYQPPPASAAHLPRVCAMTATLTATVILLTLFHT